MQEQKRLLVNPAEAAEMMGIGRSKVYELIRSGAIKSVRIGTSRRIPVIALREFVAHLGSQVPA